MSKSKEMEIAIKIAGKVESSFKTSLNIASKGIGSITKAISAATAAAAAAVAAIGIAAVNVGREFEAAMSQVAATMLIDKSTEAGQKNFEILENAARECGRSTAFSATEAAEALNYLALAGYDAEKAAIALPTVLKLAGAGAMDLAAASDMVTDSMSALGIAATEQNLTEFSDQLAQTASKANTSVAQLGEGILTVGGTAKGLAGGTVELNTALGILADNGLKGAEGGTHLRNIILSLQNPTDNAAKAMKSLGIDVYDSQGKMRGLNDVFEDLQGAMDGMNDAQKDNILSTLFNKTDLTAANAMLSNCTDRFDELSEAIKNSTGACENMYAIQLDNLNGDIDILKSGLSDLGISIYQDLNEPLRNMTQLATSMVEELSSAYQDGGMSRMVGAVGGCLSETVNTIASFAPEIVSMGVSLLDNFIDGIVENSGLLADAAADVLFTYVEGLFTLIPQVILAGIDIVTEFAGSITSQLPQLISKGTQALTNFVNGIVQRLPVIITTAIMLVQTLVNSIGSNAPMLVNAAVQLIGSLVLGIGSMLPQLLQMGIQLIVSLVQGILSNLPLILQMAVQIITNFVSGIASMIPMIIQGGIQLIISLIQGIISNLGNIVQAAVEIVMALATGLIQAIPTLISAVPQLIVALIETILQTNWLQVGIDIVKGIINGIMSTGKSLWEAIKSLITYKGEKIDIPDSGAVTQQYTEGIKSNAYVVGDALESLSTTAFSSMDYTMATTAGTELGAAFNSGLVDSSKTAAAGAAALTTGLTEGMENSWQMVDTNAQTAMQNLTTTVSTEAQSAANAVKSAFEDMTITIPKPKIPNISVSANSVTYGEGGSVSIPQFSVNWNAAGGIFGKPTILDTAYNGLQGVGEAGAEAVLPLDTLWSQMKNMLTGALKQNSGTGIIESLLQKLQGLTSGANRNQTMEFAGAGGPNITYAPVYNLYGNATKEDAVKAEKISQTEFNKMMRQWQKENQRTKF